MPWGISLQMEMSYIYQHAPWHGRRDCGNTENTVSMVFGFSQREFLANISHDLRTPLTMIKGFAKLMREISWEDDSNIIIREADRLTALVNEIFEFPA